MKRNKIPKARKGAWFVSVRNSYLPVSWQGWLTYIPYILLIMLGMVNMFWPIVDCMKYECSTRMTATIFLSGFVIAVPYFVALVVAMQWIAKRKS